MYWKQNTVQIHCTPYPGILGPRTFGKLILVLRAEFQPWGTIPFSWKAVCLWANKDSLQFLQVFLIPGMNISCDILEDGLKPDWRHLKIALHQKNAPVVSDFQVLPFQADPLTFGGASIRCALKFEQSLSHEIQWLLAPYYQRKLGSNTSVLRTNRIVMKGGVRLYTT